MTAVAFFVLSWSFRAGARKQLLQLSSISMKQPGSVLHIVRILSRLSLHTSGGSCGAMSCERVWRAGDSAGACLGAVLPGPPLAALLRPETGLGASSSSGSPSVSGACTTPQHYFSREVPQSLTYQLLSSAAHKPPFQRISLSASVLQMVLVIWRTQCTLEYEVAPCLDQVPWARGDEDSHCVVLYCRWCW